MNTNTKNISVPELVEAVVQTHGARQDSFIPILLEVNKVLGYIPVEALVEIRRRLHVPENQVFVNEGKLFSLASFYELLSTEPRGRHVVVFCESAPCHVVGGRQVWLALQEYLNLKAGQTSPDGKWTLITTSCLGACSVGPVVVVDDEIYGNVIPEKLPEILAKYE